MDKHKYLKSVIDKTDPSPVRRVALIFMLAMPKSVEDKIVETIEDIIKTHEIDDNIDKNLAITLGFLSVALRECVAMAKKKGMYGNDETEH